MGGYVCHDTFDHTSVTRLLEQVTGVVNPNITAWRRQTVGRLHHRARRARPAGSPRLPDTKAQLELAEKEVLEFQLPPFPGASQAPPAQPAGNQAGARRDSRRCDSRGSVTRMNLGIPASGASRRPARPSPAAPRWWPRPRSPCR